MRHLLLIAAVAITPKRPSPNTSIDVPAVIDPEKLTGSSPSFCKVTKLGWVRSFISARCPARSRSFTRSPLAKNASSAAGLSREPSSKPVQSVSDP